MSEYIEINLIGIVILMTILVSSRKKQGREFREEHKFFITLVTLNIFILFSDICIYLLRGYGDSWMISLNHICCMAYFIMHGWFGYGWFRYVMARMYPRHRAGKTERAILLLPALTNSLITAVSPMTGWIYSLSVTNTYFRGPFIRVSFASSAIYWMLSFIMILQEKARPTKNREESEYLILLFAPVPTIIGNILQMHFYGLSIVWICSAISLLILFINIQNHQMSLDKLTGLFNRGQANAQLIWEVSHLRSSKDLLFVVMLDLDSFKKINDRCGHLAGDEALKMVAEVLKENCRKSDLVCRFGGDEFLLIEHIKSAENAEMIIQRIQNALKKKNENANLAYTVTLSAGYAVYGSGDKVTTDDILNHADHMMYEEKRRKKEGNS